MTSEQGAFFTAEDADSEGREGKFYVWTRAELQEALGEKEAAFWAPVFNIATEGNYVEETGGQRTGANIFHLKQRLSDMAGDLGMTPEDLAARWETARRRLFLHREKRIHPLKDDKILTDWNGLMISALSNAARILHRTDYADAARKAADFIMGRLSDGRGRLLHKFRNGRSAIEGFADDYAFFIRGLIDLYGATFLPDYLEAAVTLQNSFQKQFWDGTNGGYFLTQEGSTELPVRPKSFYDGAIPSANSIAMGNLLRLSRLTGDVAFHRAAAELAEVFTAVARVHPQAFTRFLTELDTALHASKEIVVVEKDRQARESEMIRLLDSRFSPDTVVLYKTPETAAALGRIAPFSANCEQIEDKPTAYVCVNFRCKQPTTDPLQMIAHIDDVKGGPINP